MIAAADPGLVIAIVVVAVTLAAALVLSGVARSLRGWRDSLQGLDDEILGHRPPGWSAGSERAAELRQLLEAKSYRRERAGLAPLDVDAELARLLGAPADRLVSGRQHRPEGRPVDVSELKNIPLFSEVDDAALNKIAVFATLESAVEGKVIIQEGGAANAFYALEDGTVSVERGGEHLADLGPGDVFGEQALLEKQERSATVTATSPVRMIKIEHWEIPRMRQAMPEVLEELKRKVEERTS